MAEIKAWWWVPYTDHQPFVPAKGCSLERNQVVCLDKHESRLGVVSPDGTSCQLFPVGKAVSKFQVPEAGVLRFYQWKKVEQPNCIGCFGANSHFYEGAGSSVNCVENSQILCRFISQGDKLLGLLSKDKKHCLALEGKQSQQFELLMFEPQWNVGWEHVIWGVTLSGFLILYTCSFAVDSL
ncbi:MAG: hypothetical protein ACR2PX_26005 [Endozoicomonas sp.]